MGSFRREIWEEELVIYEQYNWWTEKPEGDPQKLVDDFVEELLVIQKTRVKLLKEEKFKSAIDELQSRIKEFKRKLGIEDEEEEDKKKENEEISKKKKGWEWKNGEKIIPLVL